MIIAKDKLVCPRCGKKGSRVDGKGTVLCIECALKQIGKWYGQMTKNETSIVSAKKTIQIDFDNVLHLAREGFKDGEIYDVPVDGAVFTTQKLIRGGYHLVVLTARDESDFPKIKEWMKKHGFPEMEITNKKIPALAYIDNRAIRFTYWADLYSYFL